MNRENETLATLAGGCFWCLEAVFQEVHGVNEVVSGYSGGHVEHPSYEEVCSETTGHAEVVQVSFDPNIISYEDLLGIFFSIHDPTTLNRQGNDVGTSYRSAIFFHTEGQRHVATRVVAQLADSGLWSEPIVTEITPLSHFFPAEDYHQGYYQGNQNQPYCQYIISPKLLKFRKEHVDKLKTVFQ